MARRAPADLRVNTLKSTPEKVLKALAGFGASPCPYSPIGVRVPAARRRAAHAKPAGRGGVPGRMVRNPGRGFADRRGTVGRRAEEAGAGPLRWGGRQDAGARRA